MAIREYVALLRDAPDQPDIDAVLFRIAECYRLTKNNAGAENFYKRLLAQYPDSAFAEKAAFRRAELYVLDERYEDGALLFRDFIGQDPSPDLASAAHFYLGKALAEQGASDEAETHLQRVAARTNAAYYALACLELGHLYRGNPARRHEAPAMYRRAAAVGGAPAAEALFQMVHVLFVMERFEECAKAYDRLAAEYPDHRGVTEAAEEAAWAYHQIRRYADALALAGRARSDTPDAQAQWLYIRANCYRQLLRHEDALAAYGKLLNDFPEHDLAKAAAYEKVLVAFNRGQMDAVIEQARVTSLDQGKLQEDFYWLVARAYTRENDRDRAVQFYRLLMDHYPESPRISEALYSMADILRKNEEWISAAENYRRLADAYPDHALAPEALMGAAYCRVRADGIDRAMSAWKQVADHYPETPEAPEALFQLGLAAMRSGDHKTALNALGPLVKTYPESERVGEALFWMGTISEQADDPERAVQYFEQAVARGGALAWRAKYRLAALRYGQEQYDEAADVLQGLLPERAALDISFEFIEWLCRYRIEQEEPQSALAAADALAAAAGTDARRAVARYLKGRAFEALKKSAEAVDAYRQAVPYDFDERALAGLRLAEQELRAGELDAAAERFRQTLEWAQNPERLGTQARAYLGLGRVAEQRGEWMNASKFYMSVAVLFDDPECSPEALYRAVMAFLKQDRQDEALNASKELMERYPDSPWTRKVMEEYSVPSEPTEQ